MKNIVERECKNCGMRFEIDQKGITYAGKKGREWGIFCSQKCRGEHRTITQKPFVECTQCGVMFRKRLNQNKKSKSGNHFCSNSCAATYNNRNKKSGYRRSKLEQFIENRLHVEFPQLKIVANAVGIIGLELDFYLPQLKLAIEINGIFHYQPIYGEEKLIRMQKNDVGKHYQCNSQGIYLFVYRDEHKRFTTPNGEETWNEIREVIQCRL